MVDDKALRAWFATEVLPFERELMHFIARHSRQSEEVIDVRQESYERALKGARGGLPRSARRYVLTIARNVLIDRARRERVVSFDHIADLENIVAEADRFSPDHHLEARDELRRAMAGLEQLPPRCREVVRLRRVEGLSIRETAAGLGVSEHTVERQLTLGLRALVDYMHGGEGRIDRTGRGRPKHRKVER
ncbi:sigma-70 family RNA polymerase sigma factor [Erythrobacter sp. 3-20A1M]|uniref:RNA polymerase sigma factor n=1 Tax=Erythrobacter sp. 3-20A1M TaxID=2653850 RepID=UPI001BFC8C01|nr:RNA polymerase sigma factor [Erythrobacter sp. 3-20A1M]QWC57457.1 sigma-70 family RNA polymerase sigma factor [Erythrobacter sp. 3-20A1M]